MSLASMPAVDRLADRAGRIRQLSGWDQGMWTKWWRKASGRAARIIAGRRVEVVVVEHHQRLVLAPRSAPAPASAMSRLTAW